MVTIDEKKIVIQQLEQFAQLPVSLLRLDLLHPVISGNKWYKLKHNLLEVKEKGLEGLLTFGGAWSNHLAATAGAAKEAGLKAVAIVRGLHGKDKPTATIQQCLEYGMELHFVSREEYAMKHDATYLQSLSEKYPNLLIVPYGGSNEAGRKGAEEIATLIPEEYTHVCCAVGSGTTLIGLRNALPEHQLVLGFAPLKKGTYLRDELQPFIATPYDSNWSLTDEFHFGGFGKWEYNQIHFMNLMYALHEVPLDVVYTSKMLFGVRDLIAQSYFPKNSNILCVHSGGLQGNISVANHLIF